MTTTFDIMLGMVDLLRDTYRGTATGGSTTTLVDAAQTAQNDWFNGGTIFFVTGGNAGKSAVVSDYANTTTTFTFAAQTAACANGDQYAVVSKFFPRAELMRAINAALGEIGQSVSTNATLTGASGTYTYALPSGVSNIVRVTVDDEINFYWRERNGYIVFDKGKEPSGSFTLWYIGRHAAVSADANTISADIEPTRLTWLAAYYAALNRMLNRPGDEPQWKAFLELAQMRNAELAARFPVKRMSRDPHLMGV